MLALPMLRQKMRATAESKSEWRTADDCDPRPRASLAASEPVVSKASSGFPQCSNPQTSSAA
jgi:hypothetical protein